MLTTLDIACPLPEIANQIFILCRNTCMLILTKNILYWSFLEERKSKSAHCVESGAWGDEVGLEGNKVWDGTNGENCAFSLLTDSLA